MMQGKKSSKLFEKIEFRDQVNVFTDRADAGRVLAEMLEPFRNKNALILAIPAGGVEVAVVIARELNLSLDVAVVSTITPPWNTEIGYGAVAYDGTVLLNEALLPAMHLTEEEIRAGVQATRFKVKRRMQILRGGEAMQDLAGRSVILVDDGLASGYTMRAAVEAVRKSKPAELVIAVPTSPLRVIRLLESVVDRLYCGNIRTGWDFAVADAYRNWSDVSEERVIQLLDDYLAKY